jgi:hypothetical protein
MLSDTHRPLAPFDYLRLTVTHHAQRIVAYPTDFNEVLAHQLIKQVLKPPMAQSERCKFVTGTIVTAQQRRDSHDLPSVDQDQTLRPIVVGDGPKSLASHLDGGWPTKILVTPAAGAHAGSVYAHSSLHNSPGRWPSATVGPTHMISWLGQLRDPVENCSLRGARPTLVTTCKQHALAATTARGERIIDHDGGALLLHHRRLRSIDATDAVDIDHLDQDVGVAFAKTS